MTPYNTDYDTSKELKHDANVYCGRFYCIAVTSRKYVSLV